MRLPDPTFEESFEQERDMRFATCEDCKHHRPIPVAYGDPHVGYCIEEDDYVSGCANVRRLGCENFEWREY